MTETSSRKAQWEATRRMAELGNVAMEVRKAVHKTSGDAAAWLDAYVSKDGWFRLDQAQRRLEAWVANLDEEPEERPLGVVRRAYEDTCHAMAEGFTKALVKAGWTVPGALHQTRVWSEVVADRPKPVAYFLVDAMRFEMGVELAERLPKTSEVSVRAAVGALPSITPIGMAALQPGASASFSVVEQGGKLGARIDDSFLPDLATRKKLAAARVPKLVDVALDELLSLQPSKLAKKLEGASGRRRPLAGDRPRRRDGLHVPGAAGHGHRHRQPRARHSQARGGGHRARGGQRRPRPPVLRQRPRRVDAHRRPRRRHRGAASALLDRSRRCDAAGLRARRRLVARLRLGPRVCLPCGDGRLQGGR